MAKIYVKNTDGTYTPQSSVLVSNLDIVQDKGDSLTSAMSQKAVTDELKSKQDTINDLDAIRQGAEKGSTALQSESDPIYTADKPNLALKSELNGKVDKEEGKGLSSNDYTDAEKAKLTELEKKINGESLDATNLFIAGKYIDARTLSIADDSTKSMTGVIRVKTGTKISINTSTPSIVSVITQCDENGNTIKGLLQGDGKGLHDYEYTIGFNGYIILSAHSFYHTCTITVPSILDEKQDTLVSGENIKTINGKSLLGKGDINIKLYKNQPLRLYPNNKTMSAISFVFDDAGASNTQDDKVVELFKKYGLTCGFAYIAREDLIAAHKDEYLDYQKDGFQILSHSTDASTFPSGTTQEDALNRLNTSLRRLENAGFVVNGFVAPSSTFDSSLYELPKKMYAYAFTNYIYPDINTRNANPCNLTRQTIQTGTVESIKTKIDTAISHGNILTLYGHSASFVDSVDTEQWCIARVEEIIQYCIAKRDLGLCYLGGVDDAVKYYYNL